jgi:2-methylisocitrate lyase-like PEP mutase family enzyme
VSAELAAKAERLRALHVRGTPVVLPNAWDVASAQRFEKAGFAALATTSAGVANALGHADGEAIPPAEMFAAVGRIAASVAVPVTADLEAGYGLEAKELVTRILAAGCVGLNFEDTDHARGKGQWLAAERQAERIAAIREAARVEGVPIVINARVDMYLPGSPLSGDARRAEAIRRGKLYLAAGADCVYPILAHEEAEIAALVSGIGGPVNTMALPIAPPLTRLSQLGVARITFGSLLMKVALDAAEKVLGEYVDG